MAGAFSRSRAVHNDSGVDLDPTEAQTGPLQQGRHPAMLQARSGIRKAEYMILSNGMLQNADERSYGVEGSAPCGASDRLSPRLEPPQPEVRKSL